MSATSSGKLARFTSLTVSIAGMPSIAALQRRASSMTRVMCSTVTKGRTASWMTTSSVSSGMCLRAWLTEAWRELPPFTTRTACLKFSWRMRASRRSTSSARVATMICVTSGHAATRRRLRMTSGTPLSSRNCLGVSWPIRVPRPAAARIATTRLIGIERSPAEAVKGRLKTGLQKEECTSRDGEKRNYRPTAESRRFDEKSKQRSRSTGGTASCLRRGSPVPVSAFCKKSALQLGGLGFVAWRGGVKSPIARRLRLCVAVSGAGGVELSGTGQTGAGGGVGAIVEAAENHFAGGGLVHRRDEDVDTAIDGTASTIDDDHRAIVEVGDALVGFLPFP